MKSVCFAALFAVSCAIQAETETQNFTVDSFKMDECQAALDWFEKCHGCKAASDLADIVCAPDYVPKKKEEKRLESRDPCLVAMEWVERCHGCAAAMKAADEACQTVRM